MILSGAFLCLIPVHFAFSSLGLAELVTTYVAQLNNPGTVVNVEKTWDNFVSTKCTTVKAAVISTYDDAMKLQMKDKMPCESDVIHLAHKTAFDKALNLFREETFGISTANVEKYLKEITVIKSNCRQQDVIMAVCVLQR